MAHIAREASGFGGTCQDGFRIQRNLQRRVSEADREFAGSRVEVGNVVHRSYGENLQEDTVWSDSVPAATQLRGRPNHGRFQYGAGFDSYSRRQ